MKTSANGKNLIKQREGVRLTAYTDGAGVWTIGVGHTSAAAAPVVKAGMTITAKESDEILARDLAVFERAVNDAVKVKLNQNEFDALLSLAFNIGAGAFKNSTLVKRLNAGDRIGAADQFLVWNKITVNGKKQELKGLTTRRQAERKQFLVKSTTSIEVPAPETKPEPVAKSKRLWTWLTAAGGINVLGFGGLHKDAQLAIIAVVTVVAAYAIYTIPQIKDAIKGLFE